VTGRAYLRLSPAAFARKVVDDGYSAAAFAAFIAVLFLAEEQPERGRFRSERLLRLLLDEPREGVRLRWDRWVPYLIDHGDLVRLPGGFLYVDGWDEWQEGDVTVAERMKRLRARHGDGGDRNGVAGTDTRSTVTDPSERLSGKRLSGKRLSRNGRGGDSRPNDGQSTDEKKPRRRRMAKPGCIGGVVDAYGEEVMGKIAERLGVADR
jgi:hypothetical protein